MKQILRWDHSTQSQTKVLGEVGAAGFKDELRMADGIHSGLINPRVEGGVVHITDFLTHSNLVVKVGGIHASYEEGITRIHRFDDSKGFDELSHARVGFLLFLPLTFPEGHDMVSKVSKTLKTFHGGTSDIIHAVLIMTAVRFVMIGETMAAPVPKTTQELKDRVCDLIEAIHPPTSTRDLVFTLVRKIFWGSTPFHQETSFPGQSGKKSPFLFG